MKCDIALVYLVQTFKMWEDITNVLLKLTSNSYSTVIVN